MNNQNLAMALREAADRIENLDYALEAQKQLLEKTSALNFKLQGKLLDYDRMLGEAEERLRKAMEDVKRVTASGELCEICAGYIEDGGACEAADLSCDLCTEDGCRCKHCQGMNKWKWRGAAGEV